MTIEAPLADALEWLFRAPLPAPVEEKARLLVLDTTGCVLAARRHPEVAALEKQLEAADPGSAASAAARFAAAACWDEACEGLARAHGRPGVAVLAACSALALRHGLRYRQVLEALVAGYEIGGRLGEARRIGPGMHVDGTWPSFGVAAAVVRLLGGSAAQALAAIRIVACQLPNSLYLPIAAGANARNTYLAHASQLGMLAASAALAEVVAPAGAVQGDALAPAGEWLILEGYFKPYAAVRHVHYGAEAAIRMRARAALRPAEIRRIRLSTYAEALTYCGNRAPKTALQAQFSLSYGVACALATGELGPDSYSMQDAEVQRLEKLVDLVEDPALSRAGKRGATLALEIGGETLEQTVERVAGDPAQPMTREALLAKYARYAGKDGRALLDAPGESRYADLSPL